MDLYFTFNAPRDEMSPPPSRYRTQEISQPPHLNIFLPLKFPRNLSQQVRFLSIKLKTREGHPSLITFLSLFRQGTRAQNYRIPYQAS